MTDLADDTALRLIDAAAAVFAEKGYDGAGVAEIARRAGLTTGAIYSRFPARPSCSPPPSRRCTDDELDQLFAEHAFEGQVTDILATVGSHLVTRRARHRASALLLEAFVAARRDPEVARRRARARSTCAATALAELVDRGPRPPAPSTPSLDTEAVVHFCHAVGFGFLLFRRHRRSTCPTPSRGRRSSPASSTSLDPHVAHDRSPIADHRPGGTPTMTTNEEILGRADVNDLEAILAITNTDVDEAIHAVKDNADAIFTWDYEKGARPALNKLYEKAKRAQWNGETDLDWSIDVDPEKVVADALQGSNAAGPFEWLAEPSRVAAHELRRQGVDRARRRVENWRLSQFMHGEQGALRLHGQDRRDGAVDRRQVLRRPPR